jgi:hypothetical protein
MMFLLFECHHQSRTQGTVVADLIVKAANSGRAVRYLADQLRKEFMKDSPQIETSPTSVECSYTDGHDGLVYQKEFTLVETFASEEEAEAFKQDHHENWTTIHVN